MKQIRKGNHSCLKMIILASVLMWSVLGSVAPNEPKLYKIQISQVPLQSAQTHELFNQIELTKLINTNFKLFLLERQLFFISDQEQVHTQSQTKLNSNEFLDQSTNQQSEQKPITSQIIYQPENLQKINDQLNRQDDIILSSFSNQNRIMNTQFQGVALYHNVPTEFAKNEIFRFNGRITDDLGTDPFPFLHIAFLKFDNTSVRFSCDQLLEPGQLQFDISCKISMVGTFYFSIFAGTNGKFNKKLRKVLPSKQPTTITSIPPTPQGLRMDIVNNDLIIKWSSVAPITKLTFVQEQSGRKRQFVLANYHNQYNLPFYQFEGFRSGKTKLDIFHAQSKSQTISERTSVFSTPSTIRFEAVEHKFSKMGKGSENIKQIPWQVPTGTQLELEGQFTVDVQNKFFTVYPNYTVESTKLISGEERQVPSGVKIQKNMDLSQEGIHIIEINYLNGAAIINRPIYVGNGFPLLPDYKDLRKKPSENPQQNDELDDQCGLQSTTTTDAQKKSYVLCLTNHLRTKFGVGALKNNQQLADIAQKHTDDMIERSFTGHVNPDGEDSVARVRKAGFSGPIGQNIAYSDNIKNAHLGLQRSPAHLENSLYRPWMVVGIGFAETPEGGIIITLLFSTTVLGSQPPPPVPVPAPQPQPQPQRQPQPQPQPKPQSTAKIAQTTPPAAVIPGFAGLPQSEFKKFQQQIIKLAIERNPTITKENKLLTLMMNKWQKSSGNRHISLLSYLKVSGHGYAMTEVSRTMAYDHNFLQIIAKDNFLTQNSPKFTRVSASIAEVNDQLQILVIFS